MNNVTTAATGPRPPADPKAPRPWWRDKRVLIAAVVVGVAGVGALAPDTASKKTPPAAAASKTSPAAVLSSDALADKAAADSHGKVTEYGFAAEYDHGKKIMDAGPLEITFGVRDSWSDGSTRGSIAHDSFDIMKAVAKNRPAFSKLMIVGTSDKLVDRYGNKVPEQLVYRAEFTRATLDRINYAGIDTTQLDLLRTFTPTGRVYLDGAYGYTQP